ncbi:exopolyphosphatase-like enzyme [Chthonomonas calidirosea]|uniref:Exopolyphosphatase-related proteins n=1 Tax=Chthonomonas calidirosea (strain DSM 23976 / ICMP 18418 / T49) TaxID=1303518 RepID=S0EYS4_CHTCT|nr:bifunctional oligoribonuclease/PAP phosphatase NrnA [Chthonomonas calidirosea]CCW35163.1 Exopolyphosphatase-related proteins [Chthonomonas calidirosea T49]CEK20820.1 exopolyphosphatase-like enzyme [Chthonomonas calidirosea]
MRKAALAVARALCSTERVVLAAHVNPDGDTLGCTLALMHALKALGKEVVVLSSDGVPCIYTWMPGADAVQISTERRDFDVAVVCDAGRIDRIGSAQEAVLSAPLLVDVDHHLADGVFGNLLLVDADAAAACELGWELVLALEKVSGKRLANRAIAECLLTGIITDTGSFQFPSVTPRTFLIAAKLQRLGAAPSRINELVFENRSRESVELLGRALSTLQISPDGKVAWVHVTAKDYEELHAVDADTEGIVNHVRSIRGVLIGILFREIPGKKVRVSLRAREGADVHRIAQVFGGGGHRLAAGCSLSPPLEKAEELVVAEAIRQLKEQTAGEG